MKYLQTKNGAALMSVLIAVTILGLLSGIAGATWKTIVQRAKEQELLWRGDQYRRAIESYYLTSRAGARAVLPSALKNLTKDPRSVATVRHLRKLYPDPITGKDWVLIKDPVGRIQGVKSSSELEPFKKNNFSEKNKNFSDKTRYNEWQFIFDPKVVKKSVPKSSTPRHQGVLESPFSGSPVSRPGTNN
ncbi:MAG: type II secretion system protein [Chloroflexi bacterium]|nr:type II secretion system protein [Chloroflexota bacterium]